MSKGNLEPMLYKGECTIDKNQIVLDNGARWTSVKIAAKRLRVSKQTILERIRRHEYQAKLLFGGLILVRLPLEKERTPKLKEEREENASRNVSKQLGSDKGKSGKLLSENAKTYNL